jgi:hypothetical protein
VYVLFLDPESECTGPIDERVLSCLVDHFGPGPSQCTPVHCELLVASQHRCFATYMKSSGRWWPSSTRQSAAYYLMQNGARWRAVPVSANGEQVVEAANRCDGAPYSLAKYVTSLRFLRSFAWRWSDAPRASAHCAVLTARVLKLAGCALAEASAWYAPGTLYAALAFAMPRPANAPAALSADVEALLHGPLDGAIVSALGEARCAAVVRTLDDAVRACDDDAERATHEHRLATALLRWTCLRASETGHR